MKSHIFSVYDDKAGAYLPPFFLRSQGEAERVFADCVMDPTHNFGRHPEDFTLFWVGSIEDLDCSFEIFPTPRVMQKAVEVKAGLVAKMKGEGI